MRRYLSRSAVAFALTAAIIFNLAACKTSDLVKLAERAGAVSVKLLPVVQPLIDSGQLPRDLAKRINEFKTVTSQLADAFRSGDGNALDLTERAIQFVETFINSDISLIKDAGTRTLALAILAAADIALGEISDALFDGAAKQPLIARAARTAKPSAAATIETFAKKPRLRCRDSKTGRFAKMEVCEANPDTTTVERVK